MKTYTHDYPPSTYDLATPLKRFYAVMIDVSIAHILFIVTEKVVGLLAAWFFVSISHSLEVTLFTITFLVPYLYLLFADALPRGQSPGKRVMRISVVGFPFETYCTPFRSLLRNFPKILFSVLDAIFVFFGHRRRLGDMLGGTIVINSRSPQ